MGRAKVLLITFTLALFYLNVPVSHDSVTVSRRGPPEAEAAKWKSAVINFIIYTCAFPPTVTSQDVITRAHLAPQGCGHVLHSPVDLGGTRVSITFGFFIWKTHRIGCNYSS